MSKETLTELFQALFLEARGRQQYKTLRCTVQDVVTELLIWREDDENRQVFIDVADGSVMMTLIKINKSSELKSYRGLLSVLSGQYNVVISTLEFLYPQSTM